METIDSFAARQPDVGFTGIKIDVEGADLDVLKGARETILRHQPLVLTEFNTFEGGLNNEIELLELVKDLEYGIFGFQEAPSDSSGKFSLQRFLGQGEDLVECKMLFLVPPRLVQAFEAEIA